MRGLCLTLTLTLALAAGPAARGEDAPVPRASSGEYAAWALKMAPVVAKPDRPFLVVAELGTRGVDIGDAEDGIEVAFSQGYADRYDTLPDDPFNSIRNSEGNRWLVFAVAGPPGDPRDRIEVVAVRRDRRIVTVVVDHWRAAGPAAGKLVRPVGMTIATPELPAGEYDLAVVWREFVQTPAGPFYGLARQSRAAGRLTRAGDDPPPTWSRRPSLSATSGRSQSPRRTLPGGGGRRPTPRPSRTKSPATPDTAC